jgi:hypothetical protein
VFRIHDILVWIRIRIRGSMPLTNGSGSGYCYFRHYPSRFQQKTIFLNSFSAYYFLKVPTFTSYFKDKKSKRSHKTAGIKGTFQLSWKEGTYEMTMCQKFLQTNHTSPGAVATVFFKINNVVKGNRTRLKLKFCNFVVPDTVLTVTVTNPDKQQR